MRKLSTTQLAILSELAKPNAYLIYMRSMGRLNPNNYYYFPRSVHSSIRYARVASVEVLLALGYIEKYDRRGFTKIEHNVRITEKGREAIASEAQAHG